jgi:subtilisin-like proprotein convertase family protein
VNGVPVVDGDASPLPLERAALHVDGKLHIVRKTIVGERRFERYAEYRDIDTNALLRRVPLFWTAKARVFDVNPVAKLNDPSLQDQNNQKSAVPDAAYTEVDLDPSLTGPNVAIVDLEQPANAPIDPAQPPLFDRSQLQFEQVNAYFQIDRAQRYLQSLGYVGSRRLVDYVLPVDPHAANGTDNSYYIPSATPGRGALYLGDGGTDDAEDSDIMLHEFMHVVQDWIAPGAFGGESREQSRALGEGYADYWSFSSTYDETVKSGRDPSCIGDWDARCWLDDSSQGCGYHAGSDCLRRADSTKTMADYIDGNQSGTEHSNGEIWSSALREIFLKAGKRITDTMVIESYFDTPPSPTFRVMAQKVLDVDRQLNGGANVTTICSAMTLRGILAASECDRAPRGEVTYFQSADQGIIIPDNNANGIVSALTVNDGRSINRVFVHVRATHPARGNLRITLTAPDGTTVVLKQETFDITPDLDVTYGVDAQPFESLDVLHGKIAAGTWQLRVADVLPPDQGTLLSWELGFEFVGDLPATSRPVTSGERRTIAVAGHVNGANGTRFVSDVRVLNRGSAAARITIIYTPSGTNGNTSFAAVNAVIDPGHVVAFDDIVANELQSVGAGQLEIQGDVAQLAITSRTYTTSPGGTFGQSIPALPPSAAASPVIVNYAEVDDAFRTNYGFAEVGGSGGTVHVTALDAHSGAAVATFDHAIEPFSHGQFPLLTHGDFVLVMTATGGASILGYASVVDNRSGDPIYVPAVSPPPAIHQAIAPAINAPGANGTLWRTDVRMTSAETILRFQTTERIAGTQIIPDVLGTFFGAQNTSGVVVAGLPAGAIASTRTWTDSANGTYGQFIPFRDETDAAQSADIVQVEVSPKFRTNIGVMSLNAATVTLKELDAAGLEIARYDFPISPLQLIQISLATPVINGRVHVEASAPVLAYGSLVDNRTGDPTFLAGQ